MRLVFIDGPLSGIVLGKSEAPVTYDYRNRAGSFVYEKAAESEKFAVYRVYSVKVR